jgi:hypothetical protein
MFFWTIPIFPVFTYTNRNVQEIGSLPVFGWTGYEELSTLLNPCTGLL